jgi:hypothetical protein
MIGIAGLFCGCGGTNGKEGLVRAQGTVAQGTVLLDGQPLVDAQVSFDHPNYPETFGRTDENGWYEMAYTASQKGAFAGENTISFTTADPEQGKPERVPRTYLFGRSPLKVEVTEGGGPYDFHLSSTDQQTAVQAD